ncbi:MAG TPA: class I SAM-dependent methyltransferase [Thermoplasmata archaeon]|nr:class I SAM-dependent methyltransferase [Thermoplasmata archaeon]
MAPKSSRVDWKSWLSRWDRQQSGYMPYREERFNAMIDVVDALPGPALRAIDLASGPGSLSQRLLQRVRRAHCVAVDYDPVLLRIGHHALKGLAARLTWAEADLREPTWVGRLPEGPYDAVLSTTALHWLTAPELTRVYRQVRDLLRPGGVFMNGDHMAYDPSQTALRSIAKTLNDKRTRAGFSKGAAERWDDWWSAVDKVAELRTVLEERRRRFPAGHGAEPEFLARFHETALREAGFREVAPIWQNLDNRVMLGVA